MYIAYLCYPYLQMGDDLEDWEPEIRFEEPYKHQYGKVVTIAFQPLKDWKHDDPNQTYW